MFPPEDPVAPINPSLSADVLRLIQGRARMQGVRQPLTSADRTVPGTEVSPGLFLTEAVVD